MRAAKTLARLFAQSKIAMHAKRRQVLMAVIESLTMHGKLWLTALGRGLRGGGKHAIKRVDRLLCNVRLHEQRNDIYRALAHTLIGSQRRPIILVDWSVLTADARSYLLRASLPAFGRSLTLYEEVHPQRLLDNPKVHRAFVKHLQCVLPESCRPILVTDAGFRCPWFKLIRNTGWDFVGRLRNRTMVQLGDSELWVPCKSLYAQATPCARLLGVAQIALTNPVAATLVLIRNKKKGRVSKNRIGQLRTHIKSECHAKCQREPWLIVTSLCDTDARAVVHIYKQRMQIEEGFRDLKSSSLGWGIEHARTKSPERLQILLLIAALATLAVTLTGLAAEKHNFHLRLQANTVSTRRVLSLPHLGRLVFSLDLFHPSLRDYFNAIRALRAQIAAYA